MNCKLLLVFSFLIVLSTQAQDDDRQMLRGQVLYRNVNVPNENVINATSEAFTITNEDGEFAIRVKVGDELVFTAINYQLEVVKITEEILKKNRLVVEVNEKVTQLDEVVVSPEDQAKFLQMQNEDFRQYDYEIDRGTEVENIATSRVDRGLLQNGLNFVNIFKALMKSGSDSGEESTRAPLKVSEVLRHVYDDEFFVKDLKLPQDKIDEFLFYCDTKVPPQSLLRKDNEFQLIDFLVTQSKNYLAQLNAGR